MKSGEWAIAAAACLVGLLIALGWNASAATDPPRRPGTANVATPEEPDPNSELSRLRGEVQVLRAEKTRLENLASRNTDLSKELNESLQNTKLFAGLTEVEGPGVTLTLRDSKKPLEELPSVNDGIIHDADLIRVINELWNAGAEAITVNGKRAGPTTSYRCVGSVIVVDGARFAAPIVIRAIGDPQNLEGALNLPGGVLDEIRELDPDMVELALVDKHRFAAYDGPTKKSLARVPAEPDGDQDRS
ncbi:MAG: DUF881 domain-containing protein [Fimbriimonadaceae bacterium]|nr:DUF881 domain-containing protein [Fimbriimonadaceae bacterium]